MDEYVVQTKSLTKKYRKQIALNNISLNIKRGSIYGIIGKNGAGKSTLLKLICSQIYPSEGEIKILGYDYKLRNILYGRIGSLIEKPALYDNLNAFDNLKLKALCLGIYNEDDINNIVELIGLNNQKNKKVKNYSLGMKQRLGIGMAMVGQPDIIVLDEPINGLDPQGIIQVRKLIIKLNRERNITFIISSHILEEMFKIITHVAFIDKGEIIEEISKENLIEKCSSKIEILTNETDKVCIILDNLKINKYKVMNSNTIDVYEDVDKLTEINKELVNNNINIQGIINKNDTLEEYFVNLLGGVKND